MADSLGVMIVDDSAIYRKLLSMVIEEIPDVTLVGTAPTGPIALRKIPTLRPHVVLQDIEMPEMSGVETLEAIKREYPETEVVLVSGANARSADIVMQGLAKGAVDFVAKPTGSDMEENKARMRRDLGHAFLAVRARSIHRGETGPPRPRPVVTPAVQAPAARPRTAPGRIDVVGIGISTGGPQALTAMLPRIPAGLRVPILVVQHMPAVFTASLAKTLDARCPLRVVEAADGETVRPGTVYIAPGGIHMVLAPAEGSDGKGYRIALRDGPPVNSCKPAVDLLFESLAELGGKHVLSVVMTGMGQDGRNGVAAIKRGGGYCITQTKESCVVYGMPMAVDEAQLSDERQPLDGIAARIAQLAG